MIPVEIQRCGVCGWWNPLALNCKFVLGYVFYPWESGKFEQCQIGCVGPLERSKRGLYQFVFVAIGGTRGVEAMAVCAATANTTLVSVQNTEHTWSSIHN